MIQIEELIIDKVGMGGANEKVSSSKIPDNQSAPPDSSTLPLKNCHTNTIGDIVKRSGYTVYTGPITISGSPDIVLTSICGIYQYEKFNGNSYQVVACSNGSAQKLVNISTPASPVDITGSMTFTDDTIFDFANVADKLIMTTEARDAPIQWSGSGNASLLRQTIAGSPDTYVNAPAGKYCEEFYNYCFIANTETNPERVYWSALFDPESWTVGTDFKRLENACTGLIRRGDVLFAFTKNSIHVIQYTRDSVNPFNFTRLDTNVGCMSNRTLKNIEGVLYWRGGDGHIWRMQNFLPERMTEAIPNTIASLNTGAGSISCAEDHKELKQYWCCVPKSSSTVNDFVIVIDYLNNEIFLYDGMNVNSIANFSDSNGATKTYFGDRTGRIYLTNNGDSDYPGAVQTKIQFWRYTKAFPLSSPNKRKHLRRIKATVNNGGNYSSLVDVIADFGELGGASKELSHNGGGDLLGSTWILGESKLGRISDVDRRIDVSINGKYFQLKIHNDGYSQPLQVRDLILEYQTYDKARL